MTLLNNVTTVLLPGLVHLFTSEIQQVHSWQHVRLLDSLLPQMKSLCDVRSDKSSCCHAHCINVNSVLFAFKRNCVSDEGQIFLSFVASKWRSSYQRVSIGKVVDEAGRIIRYNSDSISPSLRRKFHKRFLTK